MSAPDPAVYPVPPAPEPSWVLWCRGLRGPELSVLHNRGRGAQPTLAAVEAERQLATPVRIEPDDELLPLRTLERLYPPPNNPGPPG